MLLKSINRITLGGVENHSIKKAGDKYTSSNNSARIFSYVNFIIIIIMSRRLRGYPWPSLAISPYHSSPPAGLQDYNPCPHIAAVCKFVLVVLLLHIHEWGSTYVNLKGIKNIQFNLNKRKTRVTLRDHEYKWG